MATPPVAALLVILFYGVNAPFLDDFLTPGQLLLKRAAGTLQLRDWIAQHNEHRVLFPRLIAVALALPGGWAPRFQMFASWAISGLTLWSLIQLIPETVKTRTRMPVLVTSALAFSTIQYQNWTFAMQVMMFLPFSCLTSALVVMRRGWSFRTRLWICAAFATVATFSAGSGMWCWLALLPALASEIAREAWRRVLSWWLAGFAVCIVCYFIGYTKPPTASVWYAVRQPLEAAYWLLAFLGSPIGWTNGPAAALASGVALVSIGGLLWRIGGAKVAVPWVSILIYTMGVAVSATVARSGDGIGQALSARYSTLALPLFVVLVNLACLLPAGRFLAGLVLAFHLIACWRSFGWMEEFWRERRYGRACMVWSGIVATDCVKQVYPDNPRISTEVNQLEALGHLPFARARSLILPLTLAPSHSGSFDGLTRLPDGSLRASGWSGRHDRFRGPDIVLLAYENDHGKPVVFAVSDVPMRYRDDITEFAKHPRIGWHADFVPSAIPRRRVFIRAYGFRLLNETANSETAWEILEIPGGPADLDNR